VAPPSVPPPPPRAGISARDESERWNGGSETGKQETVSTERSAIVYRFIRESAGMNWIWGIEGAGAGRTMEVSPLRKYPILLVRQQRLCRITAMLRRDLFYEGTSSPVRRAQQDDPDPAAGITKMRF